VALGPSGFRYGRIRPGQVEDSEEERPGLAACPFGIFVPPPCSAQAPAAGAGRARLPLAGAAVLRADTGRHLARMAEERFDVLAIGGEITGAGVALDAAA